MLIQLTGFHSLSFKTSNYFVFKFFQTLLQNRSILNQCYYTNFSGNNCVKTLAQSFSQVSVLNRMLSSS